MTRNQLKKVKNWRKWIENEVVTIVCERMDVDDVDVTNFAAELAFLLDLNAGEVLHHVRKAVRNADKALTEYEEKNTDLLPDDVYDETWSNFAAYLEDKAAAHIVEKMERLILERKRRARLYGLFKRGYFGTYDWND